jgi:hypothetical protein
VATVAPSGAGDQPAVENRNGGTVVHGGGLSSESPMSKNLATSELADDVGQSYGSRVVAQDGTGSQYTDKVGISGAVPGGIVEGVTQLGYKADSTEWVVQGGNVTRTLGGVANTLLIGGAADVHGADPLRGSTMQTSGTHQYGVVGIDVLAAPASGYNSFVTKSGNTGVASNFVRPSGAGDEASADAAANTTRAIPGELTYMFGGKNPQSDDYKATDSAET